MILNTDELAEALQENIKLRRELATEVAESNGGKISPLSVTDWRESLACSAMPSSGGLGGVSATVVELMILDGARKQYVAQLRQLDRQALLKEFEYGFDAPSVIP